MKTPFLASVLSFSAAFAIAPAVTAQNDKSPDLPPATEQPRPTAGKDDADAAPASESDFISKALQRGDAELKVAQLASTKAGDASVKEFAEMMVRDHTKAANELKEAVKGSNVDAPPKLDAKHQALYDRLSKLSGAEFDREYTSAMVDGHKEVRGMLDDRVNLSAPTATGTTGRPAENSRLDAAVNQWATKTLPAVNQHLQKAEQIQSQLK